MNDQLRTWNQSRAFGGAIVTVGAVGTLNAFGLLPQLPHLLVVLLGVTSLGICALTIETLFVNWFTQYPTGVQERRNLYYFLVNVAPALHLVTHLRESPWFIF